MKINFVEYGSTKPDEKNLVPWRELVAYLEQNPNIDVSLRDRPIIGKYRGMCGPPMAMCVYDMIQYSEREGGWISLGARFVSEENVIEYKKRRALWAFYEPMVPQ
jgi:hypothetical protein